MDKRVVNLIVRGEEISIDGESATKLAIGADGSVEVETPKGTRRVTLKPLSELFGTGNPGEDVDPQNDVFMPLFLPLESAIVRYHKRHPSLVDSQVAVALDHLGLKPEAEHVGDDLARHLQLELRLVLSLHNYSRQEVRTAIRTINRSVARHTAADGLRGYLDFVRPFFPGA